LQRRQRGLFLRGPPPVPEALPDFALCEFTSEGSLVQRQYLLHFSDAVLYDGKKTVLNLLRYFPEEWCAFD
jgi:hypothetical protein